MSVIFVRRSLFTQSDEAYDSLFRIDTETDDRYTATVYGQRQTGAECASLLSGRIRRDLIVRAVQTLSEAGNTLRGLKFSTKFFPKGQSYVVQRPARVDAKSRRIRRAKKSRGLRLEI
jgi:hypothetical protein